MYTLSLQNSTKNHRNGKEHITNVQGDATPVPRTGRGTDSTWSTNETRWLPTINCNTITQNTLAGTRTRARPGRREEAPAQGMHRVPGEHPETATGLI